MKIVVVEDEIRIREGICDLIPMLKEGYEVVGEAENGLLGLEIIRRTKPDIVITDIRMPDMDGLEMMEQMRKEGIMTKVIILSAYSEFEYARKAMKLGVTEYLLKPIVVNDFMTALRKMKEEIEKERIQKAEPVETLEQILVGILYGQTEVDNNIKVHLKSRYGLDCDSRELIELCIYLGNEYEALAEKAEREWRRYLKEGIEASYSILRVVHRKSLLIILYDYASGEEIERKIQQEMLYRRGNKAFENIGWIQVASLEGLKTFFEMIYKYMDWNITLGKGVMIHYPKVKNIATSEPVYPIELENQLKTKLCQGNPDGIGTVIDKFHEYITGDALYTPKAVKEYYVRLLWSIINISKEVDLLDYKNLSQQELIDGIMNARTMEELQSITTFLTDKLKGKDSVTENIHRQSETLTINRAKSMIHEFYRSGITLEEIAQRLDITPEYLSGQFRKVTGETFSDYIKNYRIAKAKELLIGTQMKLFEIANEVGYSDGKYFSKVFKECTGYLPTEYRKIQR